VRAAVELHEFAEPRGAHAALTMSGSTTLARRPETVLAQQTAQCFATEREALALDQFLAQMVVIEARIGSARQLHDPLAYGVGQPAVTGPPAFACARAASPSSRIRFFKRLIWRTLRHRSAAALAHAMSP